MELDAVRPADLAGAVQGYARRLHAAVGDGHHVASPLGAWLVLALAAPAARGATAQRLASVLGMSVADAAAAASELLERPHKAVAAAAAAWTDGGSGDGAAWVAGLPAAVERGPVPSRLGADAWAAERTFGLVEHFPIDLSTRWAFVLASVLATRIRWWTPFEVADAAEFRSGWRDRAATVLRTLPRGHRCEIVRHADLGLLAAHRGEGDGLTVTSVIAAPDVPAAGVLDAAHDVARERGRRRDALLRFDRPYAVVATATSDVGSAWAGLPVFSAWVAEPG